MRLLQSLRYRQITYYSFEFEQIEVEAFSSCAPVFQKDKYRHAKIPDDVLDCVFYLYKTHEDAKQSARQGGTGFLIALTSELYPSESYLYAVTNKHVVLSNNVIRINKLGGGFDIFETDPCEWYSDSNPYDLAVYPALP